MSALRPDVQTVVERVSQTYRRWRRDTPVPQMRADWDALFSAHGDANQTPADLGGVPCQWIDAPGVRTDRVVLYFHGGGFQVGSTRSHRELMACISAAASARVLGVDYRLAPEHRYPAALQDALAVWKALREQGIDASRIAVAGDSAGGGLAIALMLVLIAGAELLPAACWGMSAWTDLTASGSSYETRSTLDPIHQRPMIQAMARNYLGADGDARDPLASPLFATPAQLAMLPPTLMQVGERETVVSDSEDFARKARAAGAAAVLQVWPGMTHVFQQFPAELADARTAIAAGGQFLAAQFDAAPNRKTHS